jgi:hypothetical protein
MGYNLPVLASLPVMSPRSHSLGVWLLVVASVCGCHPLGSLPPLDSDSDSEAARVAVSPLSLDFGEVEAGTVAEQTFTIFNLGGVPVYVSGQRDPVGDDAFEVLAPDVAELASGAELELTVRFSPVEDAPAYAQLVVAPADAVVSLSGLGRAPVLEVGTPDIEPVVLGCSGQGELSLSNTGSRLLTITNVRSTASQYTVDFWPPSLNPGESGSALFSFAPDVGGNIEGTFVFETNDQNAPSVAVSALGYEGEEVRESFLFAPTDPTDIVFVIDGSTVQPYAGAISLAAEAYVQALRTSNVDYQLTAVASGDVCPGSPAYTMRRDTALRSSSVLSRGFALGGGAWDDDLLQLALEVIDASGPSGCLEGFRRVGADLEIVVVALGPSGADLDGEIVDLGAGAAAGVRISALVPTTGSCGTRADDYLLAATATGGATEDVCDADWQSAFEALAQLPGGAGEVRFPLAEQPVEATIVVEVGGGIRSGWTWESSTNELVFDSTAFTLGSEVDIHYVSAVACETGSS